MMIVFIICGCGNENSRVWQGYVEADMIYISSENGGIITKEYVDRGDRIKPGDKLFQLDAGEYLAICAEAEATLAKTKAELEDLRKGARDEEISQIKAAISKLEAVSALSDIEHERTKGLHGKNAVSRKEYDTAKWNSERDRRALDEARESLSVAMLPARKDRINAAEKAVAAAEESLNAAKWHLAQKTVDAQNSARVFDVFLRKGEYAAPGSPVMALIPDENIKVRFFVKYEEACKLKTGDRVEFSSDKKYAAHVTYISQKPEYTPPVIYSQDNTSKLVFMIEAKPESKDAPLLNPGLPVLVKVVK